MSYLITIKEGNEEDGLKFAYQNIVKEKGNILYVDDSDVEAVKEENPILKFMINNFNNK